jgi:N-lysine methyltransferase SETD6
LLSSVRSFNHKTDGEHVHFTSASDASDSDVEEDEDNESDASTDDHSAVESSVNSPTGYICDLMLVDH